MAKAAYKARSLKGAERRVRELLKQRAYHIEILENWNKERKLLAKLAAEGPCFDNPLIAHEAKKIRDHILSLMNLGPDGKFLDRASW